MFSKGDLINFNLSGLELFRHLKGKVGVICSEKKMLYETDVDIRGAGGKYFAYDLLVCGELFKNIPEEFLIRITYNEENFK